MILDFFNRLFDKILAHRKGVTYMVTSLCVANSILRRGFKEKRDITPMKLQKLMYFVFKKFYQETGERLFPERFEAWRYGPVIDNVYQVFKKYGSNHISDYYRESGDAAWVVDEKVSPEFRAALDYVWKEYSHYDGISLSEFTHKRGTAWYKALEKEKPYLNEDDIYGEAWIK